MILEYYLTRQLDLVDVLALIKHIEEDMVVLRL